MTEIIGRGWNDLYRKYTKMYNSCSNKGHIPIIMSQYGGEYITGKGGYQVFLRCGWEEKARIAENLTGTIGGLTKNQVKFIKNVSPDKEAIETVGPNWPGLNRAIEKARKAGTEYQG